MYEGTLQTWVSRARGSAETGTGPLEESEREGPARLRSDNQRLRKEAAELGKEAPQCAISRELPLGAGNFAPGHPGGPARLVPLGMVDEVQRGPVRDRRSLRRWCDE